MLARLQQVLRISPVDRLSESIIFRIAGHRGLLIGGIIMLMVIAVALLAPIITPFDPYEQNLTQRLISPVWHATGSWVHPLGTDGLGRDYLSRLIYGAQISLVIGLSAMLIAGVIGTFLGVMAGYFGGWIDMVIVFIITTRLSIPTVLIALSVVSLAGGGIVTIVLVLGLLIWDRYAVVVRTATKQLRESDYIAAAQVIGCTPARIIFREVLPNIAHHLVVIGTVEMAHAILLEAALSFLGLGVQPPTPSWGLMVAEAKGFMFAHPWLIAIPGTALFALVLAINLVGDGIRDINAHGGRT